jgi:hypothetical protein
MRLSMSFHRFGNVFTADAKNAKGLLWRLLTARAKNHLLCGLCVCGEKSILDKSEAPRPQGGASGKCRYDYRVGFPPRLPAYRRQARRGIQPTCP